MIPAALALAGALVYGSADFLGGLAAKRLRSVVVTAVAAASGLIVLFVLYPFVGGEWRPVDVAWGSLSGVFGVGAIVLLYACLAIGPMSILSPLTAVVSAVAPMMWGLLVKGESLSWIGYAGLGVALVAVVMVGFIPGEKVVRPSTRGIVMAIGSGLFIGGFLIVIDATSDASGLVPIIANRATNALITGAAVGLLLFAALRRGKDAASVVDASGPALGATPSGHADLERATHPPPVAPAVRAPAALATMTRSRAWWLAVACGAVDATANTGLLLALRTGGDLSIVAALTALYPAGTIVLAAIVLRERIAAVQWIGLALALAAGAMLAFA